MPLSDYDHIKKSAAFIFFACIACDDQKVPDIATSSGGQLPSTDGELSSRVPPPPAFKATSKQPEASPLTPGTSAGEEMLELATSLSETSKPEEVIAIYRQCRKTSDEANLAISHLISLNPRLSELVNFYDSMSFGKDRRRIAVEITNRSFRTNTKCQDAITALDQLDYSEEFDASVIALLSIPDFRQQLSAEEIYTLKGMIDKRGGKRKLAALQLLP